LDLALLRGVVQINQETVPHNVKEWATVLVDTVTEALVVVHHTFERFMFDNGIF
jgi:hypothetical protein